MDSCIFCKIISGQIPARKVYEDELVVAIEDIAPVAPVHLLIFPRRHIVNSLDLHPENNALIGHIFQVAAHLAKERGVADKGFRIVNNNNADAGQSVFHIHFHLLAGRHFNWPPG
ncbi:MAG: Hit-like protein involved in cell-cycle [Geobacteraceae bacterium]|nr:MAG: Hit-like protein involved in cell-cycle [Geobacteraceae bacterium]